MRPIRLAIGEMARDQDALLASRMEIDAASVGTPPQGFVALIAVGQDDKRPGAGG